MHILLTRPLEDSKDLIMRFKELGHQVSHLPVITIEKKDYEDLNYNEFKGIIFTSSNAIKNLDISKINKDILQEANKLKIIANTEREVLKILEGDCDTAIGVFSIIKNNKIELTAELFSVDGKSRFFIKEDDDIENHMILAKKIAGDLKIKSKGSYKG